jgi:hypothetical protein
MVDDHPALEYCRRDQEMFRNRLRRLRSGRLKFGKSIDGVTWTDTTAEDIAFAESKVAELERFLAEHSA